MPARLNLVGKKYNKLTVIKFDHVNKHGQAMWLCRCDCGNKTVVNGRNLRNNNTKSCGCLIKGASTRVGKKTHGMSKSPEFIAWRSMKNRCTNKQCKSFKNYGGRGIKVCDRWIESFQNFYDDMGQRPSKKHSIDRIDNDGDYTPENCRWTTDIKQNNNLRRNVYIECDGETKTIAEWSKFLNVPYFKIHYRLHNGFDMEQVIKSMKS